MVTVIAAVAKPTVDMIYTDNQFLLLKITLVLPTTSTFYFKFQNRARNQLLCYYSNIR